MIKRFHVLYVGQIALDNIGLDGTPANDRRYSNERFSEVFWTSRDVARLMDDLGCIKKQNGIARKHKL